MGKKKAQVLTIGQCIETVVERLTDLGYVYLGDSEFKLRQSIERTMNKRPYMCYHMWSRRINSRTIEEIDIWNPTGKVFCELRFDYEGLSDTSSITIGKNHYNGEKAIRLIEKNIFTK
jgi:hypothetical protein